CGFDAELAVGTGRGAGDAPAIDADRDRRSGVPDDAALDARGAGDASASGGSGDGTDEAPMSIADATALPEARPPLSCPMSSPSFGIWAKCGVERWSVKTGIDPGANGV